MQKYKQKGNTHNIIYIYSILIALLQINKYCYAGVVT